MSENTRATKKKKRLSPVEKAILRYGASQIIDLSAHMKQWFLTEDREFIMKDYKVLLQVSEMPDEECSFIKIVEDVRVLLFFFSNLYSILIIFIDGA
jgi:hypothetical protein